ncbi:MAG: arsenic efflux protein [Lachnospiraceae bacterium]|nr:arsenic efflux protein [Lachnospiraceae bacterium]
MTKMLFDVIIDTVKDSVRLLPFLFLTYLLIELLEHRAGAAGRRRLGAARRSGPFWGALFGLLPQCGFSAAASSLYAGRVITLGTLFAVYLSTSDEMLPVLLSEAAAPGLIGKMLAIKAVVGMASGFLVDLVIRDERKGQDSAHVHSHQSHDEQSGRGRLALSALRHAAEVFVYILLVSFVLNLVIALIGEEALAGLLGGVPVLGQFVCALVGLIPNCASSVVLTELYLAGVLSLGSAMAGLLVNAGVGLLVLLRQNRDRRQTVRIIGTLYILGVFWGLVIELLMGGI